MEARKGSEHEPLLLAPGDAAAPGPGLEARKRVLRLRWRLGVVYMLSMGVCGIVLVALGSTLEALSARCGASATEMGSVFVARGVGAIAGALASGGIYAPSRSGNDAMAAALAALAALLLALPYVLSAAALHLAFVGLGFCTAVTDTGCQIMTRRLHGVDAGPWLGANTVVFGLAGALVPLVALATGGGLTAQYGIISAIALLVAGALTLTPRPDDPHVAALLPPRLEQQSHEKEGAEAREPGAAGQARATGVAGVVERAVSAAAAAGPVGRFCARHASELVTAAMVFWLVGGKVAATAYLEDYVSATAVVHVRRAPAALMVLWLAITAARLVGLHDQIALRHITPRSDGTERLYAHLSAWLLAGAVGPLLVLLRPRAPWAFWLGFTLYGLGNGPCVGYCYDLTNRLTAASETGMAVIMCGLNFGASLVPYVTALLWDRTRAGPFAMPIVALVSMFLPIPLLHVTRVVAPSDLGYSFSLDGGAHACCGLEGGTPAPAVGLSVPAACAAHV